MRRRCPKIHPQGGHCTRAKLGNTLHRIGVAVIDIRRSDDKDYARQLASMTASSRGVNRRQRCTVVSVLTERSRLDWAACTARKPAVKPRNWKDNGSR